MKPIAGTHVKPHVPALRHQFGPGPVKAGPVKLPNLNIKVKPELKPIMDNNFFSPERVPRGALSVKARSSPMNIMKDAKAEAARHSAAIIPPNQGLKNFTAFELSKYIDKRLTQVSQTHRNMRAGSVELVHKTIDDDQKEKTQ